MRLPLGGSGIGAEVRDLQKGYGVRWNIVQEFAPMISGIIQKRNCRADWRNRQFLMYS